MKNHVPPGPGRNEPFHPLLTTDFSESGRQYITSDNVARGISQRLWVGAHIMGQLMVGATRSELAELIDQGEHYAAAADTLAWFLIERQAENPAAVSAELVLEMMELHRRRKADKGEGAQP